MNEPYAPAPGYSQQPGYPPLRRQGMGCFAKGCLTLVIVLMVLGFLGGVVGWYTFRNVTAFFTPSPVPIRTYQANDAQYRDVMARYSAFVTALNAGKAATFTLTADDLNTLIALDPDFSSARGKLFFSIENNEIVTESSFKLPENSRSTYSSGQQAYFNGRAYFAASYSSAELTMVIHKVESMDGRPMSKLMLSLFNRMDFGKIFSQSIHDERRRGKAWAEAMEHVQKIVIDNNRIVATCVEGKPLENPVPLPGQSPQPVASPSDSE